MRAASPLPCWAASVRGLASGVDAFFHPAAAAMFLISVHIWLLSLEILFCHECERDFYIFWKNSCKVRFSSSNISEPNR